MREQTTGSGIRIEAVERNQGESHTNGASSPPPLSLRKMRRMRRDVIHMCERITASGIRTEAVECNQGESHTNGASSPPPLSLLFF